MSAPVLDGSNTPSRNADIVGHALSDFSLSEVQGLKGSATVSVCIPAQNEASTVGEIVAALVDRFDGLEVPVVDELLVFDDGSTDDTAVVAADAGAQVITVDEVLPQETRGRGKGNVLWKSVAASTGDIVVWIDADLTSFQPDWILGLIGPLLADPDTALVKAHFERPEHAGSGGGRTTEIMVRPLFSTFFPQLATIKQPLVGEYAARRSVLEEVPFSMGYGVETGLLIDIAERHGIGSLRQVDLGIRTHRKRPVTELSGQAMEILLVVLDRAGVEWQPHWGRDLIRAGDDVILIQTEERPPLRSIPGFRTT